MALTLANSILADDLEIEVNGVVPAVIDIGYRFRLDDEFMEVRAFGRGTVTVLGGAATESVRNDNVWLVNRGLEATTWASHTSGAAVLGTLPAVAVGADEDLPAPWAGGAGGPVAAEDVTLDPAILGEADVQAALGAAETALAAAQPKLDAPAADVDANVGGIAQTSGTGIANANHYAESGDGAANVNAHASSQTGDASATRRAETAGSGAADASTTVIAADGEAAANLDVSSAAGTADAITAVSGVGGANVNRTAEVPSGDESASALTTVTTAGAGGADARTLATSDGAGTAAIGGAASSGSGNAVASLTAMTDTGEANMDLLATRTNGVGEDQVAGLKIFVDAASARMAFNGVTPIARPELSASPTEQDIADVLVALGLVTQAAP